MRLGSENFKGYYVTAGAYKRIRPQLSVLIDGYYFPEIEVYFAGPGIRYFRKNRPGDIIDIGVLFFGLGIIGNISPLGGLPFVSYIITL